MLHLGLYCCGVAERPRRVDAARNHPDWRPAGRGAAIGRRRRRPPRGASPAPSSTLLLRTLASLQPTAVLRAAELRRVVETLQGSCAGECTAAALLSAALELLDAHGGGSRDGGERRRRRSPQRLRAGRSCRRRRWKGHPAIHSNSTRRRSRRYSPRPSSALLYLARVEVLCFSGVRCARARRRRRRCRRLHRRRRRRHHRRRWGRRRRRRRRRWRGERRGGDGARLATAVGGGGGESACGSGAGGAGARGPSRRHRLSTDPRPEGHPCVVRRAARRVGRGSSARERDERKGARKRNREVEARCKHEQQACAWPSSSMPSYSSSPPRRRRCRSHRPGRPLGRRSPVTSTGSAALRSCVSATFGTRWRRRGRAASGACMLTYAAPRRRRGAAAGDAAAAVAVGDASGASRRLLEFDPCSEEMSAVAVWQARVSSAASPAAATRYEAWHGLLLSAARSRDQALAILALAACEHAPPGDTAQLPPRTVGRRWRRAAPPPKPRSLRRCRPPRYST